MDNMCLYSDSCSTGGASVVRTTWPPAIGPSAGRKACCWTTLPMEARFRGWKPCLGADSQIPSNAPQKNLYKTLLPAVQIVEFTKRKLYILHYTFHTCDFCVVQNPPKKGQEKKKKSHLKNKLQNGWIKKIITMLSRGLLIQLRNKFSCGFPSKR